jgi:hypothetical protein
MALDQHLDAGSMIRGNGLPFSELVSSRDSSTLLLPRYTHEAAFLPSLDLAGPRSASAAAWLGSAHIRWGLCVEPPARLPVHAPIAFRCPPPVDKRCINAAREQKRGTEAPRLL